LKASFNFSCGTTLPDKTWEVVACTIEIALFGTSSTFSTSFPGFWESREKLGSQNKTKRKGKHFISTRHYKLTCRDFLRQLLAASLLRKLLAASLLWKLVSSITLREPFIAPLRIREW